jgi:transcription antitermination factor NusG
VVERLPFAHSFGNGVRFELDETDARTEGGEALLDAPWFAIWTHSHCEQLVQDQLKAKDFRAFLPMVRIWSRRSGVRRLIARPMFPGYLFVHHMMDKPGYIEILKTKGVARILGGRWDRLTPVADAEIEALQRVITADQMVLPHPFMREGQRVRIDAGPLAGIEGIFVRSRPNRGLLVLSVNLVHQSVAVEVDCTTVIPVGGDLEDVGRYLPPLLTCDATTTSSG